MAATKTGGGAPTRVRCPSGGLAGRGGGRRVAGVAARFCEGGKGKAMVAAGEGLRGGGSGKGGWQRGEESGSEMDGGWLGGEDEEEMDPERDLVEWRRRWDKPPRN